MKLQSFFKEQIENRISLKNTLLISEEFLSQLNEAIELTKNTIISGKKILIAGNGGSAADAQGFAGELVGRFNFDRPGLPAIALTTDTSVMTAIGNDYDFESIFSRQIDAIGQNDDLFFAISTSGRSKNIIKSSVSAKKKKMKIIAFTGAEKNKLYDYSDISIKVPSNLTPDIQEIHLMSYHLICHAIELDLFG